MNLIQWAIDWKIPFAAIDDLRTRIGANGAEHDEADEGKSEAYVASQIRLEAASKGIHLWRNNVGALEDKTGRIVRFGLANESSKINKVIKSGDFIGCRKEIITPEMVGYPFGRFVSRETKEPGWHYTGTEREEAQLRFAMLVCSLGGDAAFATGPGSL